MFAFEYTIQYIERNLNRKITIDELAKHSKYSKYHFCRLFKETVGQSVGDFIKQKRLLCILHEIQLGSRGIDAIMYYGFETYAGFYKAFIKMFGCAPSTYIREHTSFTPINSMEGKYMNNYETNRCVLSTLHDNDFPESMRLLTDKQVRLYLGGSLSEQDAYRRLRFWTEKIDSVHYAVRLKETHALIGIISISPHHRATDKEISYQFLPEYWGKGYAYESLHWILHLCRNYLHLDFVVSETQSANARSIKLLKKLGYKLDGTIYRFSAEQCIYKKNLISHDTIDIQKGRQK